MPRVHSKIKAIEFYLPEERLTNDQLGEIYEGWSSRKIEKKTGIKVRHIASAEETAADLGYKAAIKLFAKNNISPSDVDYLLFCTESPDYPLPPSSCILQNRLGLPITTGALDFNLGCSGFVYGLGVAHGLISSGQAKNVLLITAETYSKYIHPQDKSVRTIFGDGAAATLITESDNEQVGPFVYGTDGAGATNLIVPKGASRGPMHIESLNLSEKTNYPDFLFMNGPEIFNFTIQSVPKAVKQILIKSSLVLNDIDCFIFHQANKFMLEHLRQKIDIPKEKFFVDISETGNTVSSTIPIALHKAKEQGFYKEGDVALLIGFGVGYSWAATILR